MELRLSGKAIDVDAFRINTPLFSFAVTAGAKFHGIEIAVSLQRANHFLVFVNVERESVTLNVILCCLCVSRTAIYLFFYMSVRAR